MFVRMDVGGSLRSFLSWIAFSPDVLGPSICNLDPNPTERSSRAAPTHWARRGTVAGTARARTSRFSLGTRALSSCACSTRRTPRVKVSASLCRGGPTLSGMDTYRGWSRGRSMAIEFMGLTSPSWATDSTRTRFCSIPAPRRSGAESSGVTNSMDTAREIPPGTHLSMSGTARPGRLWAL